MSSNYTGISSNAALLAVKATIPADGDPRNAASVNVPFEQLTDLCAYNSPAVLMFGAASTPGNTSLVYLRPGFVNAAADGTPIGYPWVFTNNQWRLRQLVVQCTLGPTGGNVVLTVNAMGNATPFSVTIVPTQAFGSDQTHTYQFPVNAGNGLICVTAQGQAGITAGLTNVMATLMVSNQ